MVEQDIDHRLFSRILIRVKVRHLLPLKAFDQVYSAATFDIGRGGMGLEVEGPVEEGTDMILEFDPKECGLDQEVIRISAKSIWSVREHGTSKIGVMFVFLVEHMRARLEQFVSGLTHGLRGNS